MYGSQFVVVMFSLGHISPWFLTHKGCWLDHMILHLQATIKLIERYILSFCLFSILNVEHHAIKTTRVISSHVTLFSLESVLYVEILSACFDYLIMTEKNTNILLFASYSFVIPQSFISWIITFILLNFYINLLQFVYFCCPRGSLPSYSAPTPHPVPSWVALPFGINGGFSENNFQVTHGPTRAILRQGGMGNAG